MNKIILLFLLLTVSCDTLIEVKVNQNIKPGQTWILKNENLYRQYHIDVLVTKYKKPMVTFGFIDGHLFTQDSLKESIFRRLYKLKDINI